MNGNPRAQLAAFANRWIPRAPLTLFAASVVAALGLALTQLISSWTGAVLPKAIASIDVARLGTTIGSVGVAAAFLVTLFMAQRHGLLSRQHIPSLSMTLTIKRFPCSLKYDTIAASLEARNSGSGLCTVREVKWAVVVASPYGDETVESMAKDFADDSVQEELFPWHTLAQRTVPVHLLIEPKETEQLTQEFVILSEIGATMTSVNLVNESGPNGTVGWYRRASHIPDKE